MFLKTINPTALKIKLFKHFMRLQFTLDFAGRQIIETKEEEVDATLDTEIMEANFGSMKIDASALHDLPDLVRPRYDGMSVQYVQTEPTEISTEKIKTVILSNSNFLIEVLSTLL